MDSNAIKKQINKTPFEKTVERTKQAREEVAKQLLERETILEKIQERATLGYNFYIVEPAEPIDITETSAAAAFISEFNAKQFKVTTIQRKYEFFPKFKELKEYVSNHYRDSVNVPLLLIEWEV